jgi:hypothetical protein
LLSSVVCEGLRTKMSVPASTGLIHSGFMQLNTLPCTDFFLILFHFLDFKSLLRCI